MRKYFGIFWIIVLAGELIFPFNAYSKKPSAPPLDLYFGMVRQEVGAEGKTDYYWNLSCADPTKRCELSQVALCPHGFKDLLIPYVFQTSSGNLKILEYDSKNRRLKFDIRYPLKEEWTKCDISWSEKMDLTSNAYCVLSTRSVLGTAFSVTYSLMEKSKKFEESCPGFVLKGKAD